MQPPTIKTYRTFVAGSLGTQVVQTAEIRGCPRVVGLICRVLMSIGIAAGVSACGANTIAPAFEAYWTATAPEYTRYVDSDPALSAEQKARRHMAVDSAKRVIDEAKAASK